MGSIENWILLVVMSGITILLRAFPLLMPRALLRTPWMLRLNQELPLCVMVILVVHSLASPGATAPLPAELLALVAVAVTYLRWRNALLSVVTGLATLALVAPALVRLSLGT
jgi:branched-subunit amino acid transport protein AzlD